MIRRASRPDQTFWPPRRGGLVFERRRWPSFHPALTRATVAVRFVSSRGDLLERAAAGTREADGATAATTPAVPAPEHDDSSETSEMTSSHRLRRMRSFSTRNGAWGLGGEPSKLRGSGQSPGVLSELAFATEFIRWADIVGIRVRRRVAGTRLAGGCLRAALLTRRS